MILLFLKCALITVLAAGAFAQAPGAGSPEGVTSTQPGPPALNRHLEHIAQIIGLTDPQREQARTIFRDAWNSSKPVRQELRLNRERLRAAEKLAVDADIQGLANEQGRLMGQLVAIHTRASAKFYQILTPEQRVKYDQMGREQKFHSERNAGP